jgi:hypothetical protein
MAIEVTVKMAACRKNSKLYSELFVPLDVRTKLFGIFSGECDETYHRTDKQLFTDIRKGFVQFGKEIWYNMDFGSGVATNIVRLDIKRLP